eukprot:4368478-Amphidinium_carterae.1
MEVLPEIEQRLAEMDMLQQQLVRRNKDDTKRFIGSPEVSPAARKNVGGWAAALLCQSLQKLEALRLHLSKL